MGSCAAMSGAMLFMWEPGRRAARHGASWFALAALGCAAVGSAAAWTGRVHAAVPPARDFRELAPAVLRAIPLDGLTGDADFVGRLSRPFSDGGVSEGVGALGEGLHSWPLRHAAGPVQNARNLLCVAAIADVSEDPHEGEIARLVYSSLRADNDGASLERILGWIILHPNDDFVVTSAPELGLGRQIPEALVRERVGLYARKFLGRLQGRLAD
jgi:ABC-2 type transport system permease protein